MAIIRCQNCTGAADEAKTPAKLYENAAHVPDKRYVLVAAMPDSWMDGGPRKVAESCRIRLEMESSCESYGQMRLRTASRNRSVRSTLSIIPFTFYNVRMLACCMATRRADNRGECGRPPCTLCLFLAMLVDVINE